VKNFEGATAAAGPPLEDRQTGCLTGKRADVGTEGLGLKNLSES